MKKILTTMLVGTLIAGAAFAEFSVKGNVRFESDVFTYTTPSRSERPNDKGHYSNGDVRWAKDMKHGDDITLQASGDNVGAKIVLAITGNYDNTTNGGVGLTSYQGWVDNLFGLRLDAGAYDQRLNKNLNNDGDWVENLSATRKTGLGVNLDGADWGKDAGNLTTIQGNKRTNNFQVSKSGLLDGKLAVRGALFLSYIDKVKTGLDGNGDDSNNDNWIFPPFALGATYALDKNTQFSVVGKLNSITKKTQNTDKTTEVEWKGKLQGSDNSVYTLNFDFYKKLGSGIELQAAYTLGMSLYSNWSGNGARDAAGNLVRDYDVFAHGVDFRVKNVELMDALSLTALANVTYVQGTAVQKKDNRTADTKNTYKDALAKSYKTGAAGQLAYYATVSLDYKQSDMVTFQVQAKLADTNLFSADKKGDHENVYHVDYLDGMSLIIRPAVIVNVGGTSRFFAGVRLSFDGFQQYASGNNNTFKVSAAVPVGLRIKL